MKCKSIKREFNSYYRTIVEFDLYDPCNMRDHIIDDKIIRHPKRVFLSHQTKHMSALIVMYRHCLTYITFSC